MTFALYTQFLELVVEGDAAKIRAFFAANPRISPLNPDEAEQIKARMHTPTAQGDFKGTTPLCWAAAEGSADIITTFKKLMTPAEWRRSIITPIAEGHAKGWTPIFLAADKGQADAIAALIAGLTPEQQEIVITTPLTDGPNKGHTPVDMAATMGHADTITALIAGLTQEQQIAVITTPLTDGHAKGWTPISLAADRGHAAAITALIAGLTQEQQIAVITTPFTDGPNKGWTPISLAADLGDADAITALIAGLTQEQQIAVITAPITEGHAKGRTPVDIAATMGHADTVTTIAALGAHTNTSLLSRGLQTCLGELDSTYKQTQVDTHITARRNELRENAKALVILGAKVPSSSWWRKKNILTEEFLQELRSLKPSPQITTSRLFNGLAFAFTRGGNSSPTATEGLHARLLGPVGERQL